MRSGNLARAVSIICVLVAVVLSPLAQVRQPVRDQSATRPPQPKIKLVVGIVIDQFRYDYLMRFEEQFTTGGFRRFLQNGANFTDNNYLHTPTYTAPGHATFMSGATPALNGIIGNDWYDRATGKNITSVEDTSVIQLGGRDVAKAWGRSGGFCLRIRSAHSFHSELSANIWLYIRTSELAGVNKMLNTGVTRS